MDDINFIQNEFSKDLSQEEEKEIEEFLHHAGSFEDKKAVYNNGVIKYTDAKGNKAKWAIYDRLVTLLSASNSDTNAVRYSTIDFWRRPDVVSEAPFLRNPRQMAKLLGETSALKRKSSKQKTRSVGQYKTYAQLRDDVHNIGVESIIDLATYLQTPINKPYKYWQSVPAIIDKFVKHTEHKKLLWSLWLQQAFRRNIVLDVMNKAEDPEAIEVVGATIQTNNFDIFALSTCSSKTDAKVKKIVDEIFEQVTVTPDFLEHNVARIIQRENDVKTRTKDIFVPQIRDQKNYDKWIELRETPSSLYKELLQLKNKRSPISPPRRPSQISAMNSPSKEDSAEDSSDDNLSFSLKPPTVPPKNDSRKRPGSPIQPENQPELKKKCFLIHK